MAGIRDLATAINIHRCLDDRTMGNDHPGRANLVVRICPLGPIISSSLECFDQ